MIGKLQSLTAISKRSAEIEYLAFNRKCERNIHYAV